VLLEFARKRGLKIDEFVEVTISSPKTSKQRRIDELLQLLNKTDTQLSRLGRSTAEVIALVNALVQRNIRLIAIKQNLDIQQQDISGPEFFGLSDRPAFSCGIYGRYQLIISTYDAVVMCQGIDNEYGGEGLDLSFKFEDQGLAVLEQALILPEY
jgi:Resolvase, N terminal domain